MKSSIDDENEDDASQTETSSFIQTIDKSEIEPIKNLQVSQSFVVSVASCMAYSFCSVSMVIANKYVARGMSSDRRVELSTIAVLIQCIIAVICVEIARLMKFVSYSPFSIQTAYTVLPLNLLFIATLCSGFFSIAYLSVPMVTIFKNSANLLIVFGDWYLFNERYFLLHTNVWYHYWISKLFKI